jgi:hypothetical protein
MSINSGSSRTCIPHLTVPIAVAVISLTRVFLGAPLCFLGNRGGRLVAMLGIHSSTIGDSLPKLGPRLFDVDKVEWKTLVISSVQCSSQALGRSRLLAAR